MEKWVIDKTIEFNYGHRVWNQKLDAKYTDGSVACKCRHLHGHQAKVQIFLEANELGDNGMVTDFKHLGWANKFFDTYIDHKFIIDINDPIINRMIDPFIRSENNFVQVHVPEVMGTYGQILDMDYARDMFGIVVDSPTWEYLESFFIVDFVPTSENLSRWAANFIHTKMQNLGVYVSRVDWWETPRSRSTYIVEAQHV